MFEYMIFGKERRLAIVAYLENSFMNRMPVNRRYWPQMKKDPDLRKLVKKGIVKIERIETWGKSAKTDKISGTKLKKYGHRQTYLILVK